MSKGIFSRAGRQGRRRKVSAKAFNNTACVACQKHLDIEFRHGTCKVALEGLTIRYIFIDFHPCVRIVAPLQQPPGDATAARQPRLHGTYLGFGFVVVVGHPVIDVVVVQASA